MRTANNVTLLTTAEGNLRWFFVVMISLLMALGAAITPAVHSHALVHETHGPVERHHEHEQEDSREDPQDCDACRRFVSTTNAPTATAIRAVSGCARVPVGRHTTCANPPPSHSLAMAAARAPPTKSA